MDTRTRDMRTYLSSETFFGHRDTEHKEYFSSAPTDARRILYRFWVDRKCVLIMKFMLRPDADKMLGVKREFWKNVNYITQLQAKQKYLPARSIDSR